MIPLGDYPNPPTPQWATRILIGINVLVFVLVTMPLSNKAVTDEDWADDGNRAILSRWFAEDLPELEARYPGGDADQLRAVWQKSVSKYTLVVQRYGYKPGSPDLLTLLLCMFLHANFMHLAGNMLFLWIYGDNVEYRLGVIPYLVAYLGTGAAATLSFAAFNSDSMTPLVGASGAISGVLGFYLIWFPFNYIRVLLLLPLFFTWIHVRAVFVLAIYLVWDNLLPFLASRGSGDGGGVAHMAHLGGFAAGVGVAFLLDRIRGRVAAPRPQPGQVGASRPMRGRAGAAGPVPPTEDLAALFQHAIEHTQMESAAHAFARIAREGARRPEPRHVFVLANWLYEKDFTQDAAAVLRYYLKNFPKGDDLDRANLGLGILLARRLNQHAAAREYLLAAIDLTPPGSQVAEVARAELARLGE